jgi:hypothetical protein
MAKTFVKPPGYQVDTCGRCYRIITRSYVSPDWTNRLRGHECITGEDHAPMGFWNDTEYNSQRLAKLKPQRALRPRPAAR